MRDAAMTEPERWTTTEAAAYCGIVPGAFRTLAAKHSLYPVAREPGLAGQNLWDAIEVKAMQAARPGQGKGGGRPAWKTTIPANTLKVGDEVRLEAEGEFEPTITHMTATETEGETS